ncbi:Elongation of fatty acids protein [Mycena sanguinolenta]|uniref:Elongation of fatty acids protein n=1 Tax=Mycena sanguinolenta TaxID=230812 RepID=A0A8H6XFA8_9AGAR|nr:Elongation of fatty acids protein [Mycena sanguinolenta]
MSLADLLLANVPFTLPPHLVSFIPGQTPLSTNTVVFGTLAGYLALIFGIQAAMKNHPPQRLNTLFQAHNVILSAGSLLLLVLLIEEVVPIIWNTGIFNAMCAEASWTPRMEFYYMINYYFKYLELLDTVFLAFKKKPLPFLHVFHHSATALLCYSQLIGRTSISWTVISLNLTVHVLMYYYYYATAGGAKIWWKKYLTMMQIIQFVIDLFVVYFGTYGHFAATYYDGVIPHMGNCAGSETAALFGCGLLTSYLGLFINFYFQTYKKKPSSKAPRTNGVANGHANGSANGYANGKANGKTLVEKRLRRRRDGMELAEGPDQGDQKVSTTTSMSEDPEFLVSAEIFVSAGVALRKAPAPTKRKNDKRDSVRPLGGAEDKRLKGCHSISFQFFVFTLLDPERTSWLTLARGASPTGQWRSATCRLSEEGSRCLLNIYVDQNILYQTLYIHLLNHTDIRQADSSLFFRKDCLGIYCLGSQRWISNSTPAAEPVYLQFANSETCSTWLALLRSYAIPEIYGRLFFPNDGGSYRMWRQVELTVIQARNLGNTRLVESSNGAAVIGGTDNPEATDPVDLDVSCEIHLNNMLCGRTTVKKGIGSPDWHENFTFYGPSTIRHARYFCVEGEEAVQTAADGTFNMRNFMEWMADFESKFKLKTISHQLISIAVAHNNLIEQVQDIAMREVDGTPSSHQTLFRGNTIFTKVMELCMNWYGKAFLEASIGSVLRRLCGEKIAIEVDPVRSGKGTKDVEKNLDLLIYWCQEFWNQIYSVRTECPSEMRRLFETVRKLVEKHYRMNSTQESRELPWQSVSAFCFLRFIVPAILHPHLFGLCPGMPSVPVQRSLTLIAKVIQSLANLNVTVQKEDFMRGVKDFLKDSMPAMIDYILVVSTPSKVAESDPYSQEDPSDRHERLAVVNALRQRVSQMAVLNRESIPMPLVPDVPKQLAIITSAVIRNSRDYHARAKPNDPSDRPLNEFCSRCFEVEESALHRVSQLASRISTDRRRAEHSPSVSVSGSPVTSTHKKKRKSNGRPSTAPSPSDPTASRRMFSESVSPPQPSSPSHSQSTWGESSVPRTVRRHLRSTSTDSIPYPASSTPLAPLDTPDSDDKKRKGLLRGIWPRR